MKTTILILAVMAAAAWSVEGTLSLGGLVTSGNSDVMQLDAGIKLAGNPTHVLETGFSFQSSYGSQDDAVYLEKYLTEGTLKYSITDRNFASARIYWTRDEFSGISHEYGGTAGLGRQLLRNDTFMTALEVGGGYLFRENSAEEELNTGTWYTGLEIEWIATADWTLKETARITGDFNDSRNYYIGSLLEATSAITGNLSFSTSFQVDHYNVPPEAGNEKTDTALKVQLMLGI